MQLPPGKEPRITPTVWRDLTTLQLRFVDQTKGNVIFCVLWDQANNTFGLVNDNGAPTGRPVPPGSSDILQTGNAVLHLDQTTVVPGGPTSGEVTLTLPMTFKSEAAGPVSSICGECAAVRSDTAPGYPPPPPPPR